MKLAGVPPEDITHAWEDVKAMFNGGTRKRMLSVHPSSDSAPPTPKHPKNENRTNKKNNANHSAPPIVPSRPAEIAPYQPSVSKNPKNI